MVEFTDAERAAAEERGRNAMAIEPRARAARYDRGTRRMVIDRVNGSPLLFDPRMAQGLEAATDDELAEVEVLGVRFGLHWKTLDADFTVEGLMTGRFGSRRYMAERYRPYRNLEAA